MIEYLKTSLEAQAGAPAKMIEGTIEPISVEVQRGPLLDSPKPKNRVMLEADTAVDPRERIPRKMRPPAGERSLRYGASSSSNGTILAVRRPRGELSQIKKADLNEERGLGPSRCARTRVIRPVIVSPSKNL